MNDAEKIEYTNVDILVGSDFKEGQNQLEIWYLHFWQKMLRIRDAITGSGASDWDTIEHGVWACEQLHEAIEQRNIEAVGWYAAQVSLIKAEFDFLQKNHSWIQKELTKKPPGRPPKLTAADRQLIRDNPKDLYQRELAKLFKCSERYVRKIQNET